MITVEYVVVLLMTTADAVALACRPR